jgi:methionyl-tRNA formyltransferase
VEALQMLKPDLFVVVAYGQILRPNLLAVPKLGSINVHASLLPRYRGAAPIQRCLMSGETETGISIIALAPEMDAGDVALMESCPIGPDTNFGELEEQLCQLGKKCLRKVMGQIEAGTACFTPQDATQATFAAKLRAENCQIRWTESAQTLHNLVRGLSPRPGAWCTLRIEDQVVRLKILRSRPTAGQGRPGQILERTDTLRIACGSDALELLELQSEGRRPMEVASWLRGMGETKMQFHD